MACNLVTSGGRRRIEISNAQATRLLDLGEWSKLRIAWQWSMSGTASPVTTPEMAVGLFASSKAGAYKTDASQHFVGIDTALGASWTHNPASGGFYNVPASPEAAVVKKVNGVRTAAYSSVQQQSPTDNSVGAGAVGMIQFTKGSPNWLVDVISYNHAGSGAMTAFSNLLECVREGSWSTILETSGPMNGGTYDNPSGISLAVDEDTDGVLDSLVFHWNKTSPTFHVHNVLFQKFL